jgi:hypothetical protein
MTYGKAETSLEKMGEILLAIYFMPHVTSVFQEFQSVKFSGGFHVIRLTTYTVNGYDILHMFSSQRLFLV